jgi:hypothetical protein
MKNLIFTISLLLTGLSGIAQDKDFNREEHRERIKAMKVAFITQELKLDKDLAEKFWPVYNRYECLKMDLHRKEHSELENVESLSEVQAEKMLKEYENIEKQEYEIKKELFSELKKIITSKEIIHLHKLESEFNKKLWKEYRERKAGEKNKK